MRISPIEAVRTNVIGTDNVIVVAVEDSVQRVVILSTDKADYSNNAMEMTKAVGEKSFKPVDRKRSNVVVLFWFVLVMVMLCVAVTLIFPFLLIRLREKAPITITDPNMNWLLMNLDEAVGLVTIAFEHAAPRDFFMQKANASAIGDLADGVMKIFGETEKKIIGYHRISSW